MDPQLDEQFQQQAFNLLNKNLLGAAWQTYIDKKQVLVMFAEAKAMLKQKPNQKKLVASAQSLIETLSRVVRCLCLDDEQAKLTSVRGRTITMEAEALFASAEKEFKTMRMLAAKK
ncbi:MAG: hypothetical protein R3227_04750 [Reinekea sp.]|nr:hypothetical protein [Reinekea sp.]